ncbi:MAG TPA: YHS domain-containing protein [Candidatus Aminicenantes bacterium]|nr:YHS domain-containing protein [Acidobacteriota bacterium]HOS11511.1 YHS domain-containing protein [Candidatus Aminicenantes bacterium]MDD8030084.1 YHS domain-containing protein [Acidobacteriota bacterium]HOU48395.1 YHS domain-containing protein [Candidatus Aminicenantes bacterium]HPL13401.1 YHS domain-containing protein [Candidatus Aminicenantes bacterium]
MKTKSMGIVLFVLVLGLSAWAAVQTADRKAVDPVCGRMTAAEGARWTYEYQGTTYAFCCEACKAAFVKEPEKFLAKMKETPAAAAECPMTAGQASAAKEGEPAAFGFPMPGMPARSMSPCCCCCCPRMAHPMHPMPPHAMQPMHPMRPMTPAPAAPPAAEAPAEPSAPAVAPAPPMGSFCPVMRPRMMMGRGMRGMASAPGFGLMQMKDIERKVENTKDGVVITLTSKDPAAVKMIQEHIALMEKNQANMMYMMMDGSGVKKEIKIDVKEDKKEKK